MVKNSVYMCDSCGYESVKWLGKCPACGEWNTFVEFATEKTEEKTQKKARGKNTTVLQESKSMRICDIGCSESIRFSTGISEFDRVLGGGLVDGSVILLSGEPGIGKSTLLLQICQYVGERAKLLYVTGEESPSQIKLRAKRVGVDTDNLLVLSETNIAKIMPEINTVNPDIVIIDSIQTMYDADYPSSPGSVTQVKQSALQLITKAKEDGVSVIIVGHVNKDGAIAGPKVLEHMVDAVLYFEGDKQHSYRIIRAVKNRYGSTNEIGVFEMCDEGLEEIEKPSELMLAQRPKGVAGSCAVCVIEGSRPLMAEIQALSTNTVYPSPRRMSSGIDYNRTALILAVLEKRLGMKFSTQDIYINVAGGLHLEEPACDAATALAMISSYKNAPVPDDICVIGEIGLAGEVRTVSDLDRRINECARLGLNRVAVPFRCVSKLKAHSGIEIIPLKGVFDLLKICGI